MSLTARGGAVRLPKTVTGWNTARFYISFFWLVLLVESFVATSGASPLGWTAPARVLAALLAVDSVLLRPAAVWYQRAAADAAPPRAGEDAAEWRAFSPLQRLCRCVFYYEAVLSGTSGIVYAVAPLLFPWLFGVRDASNATRWSLAQFGALVCASGRGPGRETANAARVVRGRAISTPSTL
jgi:hypothetical protein